MRSERAAEVRAAIAKLPPKQRATLTLRVYQELSHEEIARALGSSVGAVKANFFHALGNLRRLLHVMTHHLSPQEFVEALDAALATGRLDHLETCAECRADLDRLRAVVADVQIADDAGAVAALLGALQRTCPPGDAAAPNAELRRRGGRAPGGRSPDSPPGSPRWSWQ